VTGEDLCGYVDLAFYSTNGVRKNKNLPEARGLRVVDQLGEDVIASYTAPLLAQALQADPDLLEDGIAVASMVLSAGSAPTPVVAWRLTPTSGTVVGEVDEKEVQCQSPGLRDFLRGAPTLPEVGGIVRHAPDVRMLGWMSATDSLWYDASDWSAPYGHGTVGHGWPSNATQFISATSAVTGAAGDVHLFRTAVTLPTARWVKVKYYGSDRLTLFIDSVIVAEHEWDSHTAVVEKWLPAGHHTFAIQHENNEGSTSGFFIACDITNRNPDGSFGTVLRQTDTGNWVAHKVVGGVKPGYNAAGVLLKLLGEAQAINITGTAILTPDFTHLVDSDGVSWTDGTQEQVIQTGTPVLEVLRRLEENVEDFDVHIKPDFTLQAFKGQGSNTPVAELVPGANLLRLDYNGSVVGGTRAIVRVHEGWVQVDNSTGLSAYGLQYETIESGESLTVAQGTRLATSRLRGDAFPRYTYTATVIARAGAVPFLNIKKGDFVRCPNRAGTVVNLRVLSIAFETPSDTPGPVKFTLELEVPHG
jgi:hypothetical protein